MTDRILAQAIIDLDVPFFGRNLKNKGDSPCCLFRPRRLLASPAVMAHVGQRMARIILDQCASRTVIGLATSGIPWATVAAQAAGLPMMFVRKSSEPDESNDMLEGIYPADGRAVLVDDLLFVGESKRKALDTIGAHGIEVTDLLVVIDRQLQRKELGPSIEACGNLRLHSMINMSEIVDFMMEQAAITPEQLAGLVEDYQRFERWDPPGFLGSKA